MNVDELEKFVVDEAKKKFNFLTFESCYTKKEGNNFYNGHYHIVIKTGKRNSERLKLHFVIHSEIDKNGYFVIRFDLPTLHSFGKGKKIIPTDTWGGYFEKPNNFDELKKAIVEFFSKLSAELQRAREEEKAGYKGKKETLENGIVKEEIRKGLYKFSLNHYFILGHYHTHVMNKENGKYHHSFIYRVFRGSVYNQAERGEISGSPKNDESAISMLLIKNKLI